MRITRKKLFIPFFLILLLALGSWIIAANFTSPAKLRKAMVLGNKYLQSSKYDEAVLAFKRAIEIEPKSVKARIELAKIYIKANKIEEAQDFLDEALKIEPDNADALLLKSRIFLLKQDVNDAENLLKELVAQNPKSVDSYMELANIYMNQYRIDEGIILLEKGFEATGSNQLSSILDEFNRERSIDADRGNTAGNISNLGIAAKDGDWVYYTCFSLTDKSFMFYKSRLDGSEKKLLAKLNATCINVFDDWVYFCNGSDEDKLYKIKTDGTQLTKLIDETVSNISIVNGWIYYISLEPEQHIDEITGEYFNAYIPKPGVCKMKIDGSEKSVIGNHLANYMTVVGSWIYYCNGNDNNSLYKVKTDGTSVSRIATDNAACIDVTDGWIYYQNSSDNNKIYKIRQDGSSRTPVSADSTLSFSVSGQWIYYSISTQDEYNGALYKIKTDGSGKSTVYSNPAEDNFSVRMYINLIDDWLYYIDMGYEYELHSYMRVKGNGESLQVLE